MRIYPAIDIKDGKCVRLFKGSFSNITVYGDHPYEIAKKWESLGGEYIHVVDLDGALEGRSVNSEAIKKICGSVSVPVQTGGGIRTLSDIESRLNMGITRVIIGTKAVADSEFVKRAADKYADKIVVGIDARDGHVAVEGWKKTSEYTAVEFAKEMTRLGIQTIVYTDISTDGTLEGSNTAAMAEMAANVKADVIASGGIGCLDHIRSLLDTGVEGVIVGRALYTGDVELTEAIRTARGL